MTEWGKVLFFLIYVTINEVGNYLDRDSNYYTCPCYCNIDHEHIRGKNDRCKQAFEMVIQDSCAVYIVEHDFLRQVDRLSP